MTVKHYPAVDFAAAMPHDHHGDEDADTCRICFPDDAWIATSTAEPVLADVRAERVRQYLKHHDQSHLPDGTGPDVEWGAMGRAASLAILLRERCQQLSADGRLTFRDIALEEIAEAFEQDDPVKLYEELIQTGAVFVQWAEAVRARLQAERIFSAESDGKRPETSL